MASSKNIFKNIYLSGLLISAGIVIISYAISFTGLFENIENKSIDSRFQTRGPENEFAQRSDVVIVGIDDDAIDNLPVGYPFPRSYYGKFIENMNRAGAKVVGIDILFDAVDLKNQESDEYLREVLLSYDNVILAGRTATETVSGDRYEIKSSTDSVFLRNIFYDIQGVKLGIIYVPNDRDFVTRRYVISAEMENGQELPTFAVAIAQYLENVRLNNPTDQYIVDKTDESVNIGQYRVANWDGYSMLLNYYGPSNTFTYISFANVMDDHTIMTKLEQQNIQIVADDYGITPEEVLEDPELYADWAVDTFDDSYLAEMLGGEELGLMQTGIFEGKIVLIGSANPEEKDLLPIPMRKGDQRQSNLTYGVEIHATAVQNILDGNILAPLPSWVLLSIMFVVAFLVFLITNSIKHAKITGQWFFTLLNFIFSYGVIYLVAYIILVLSLEYSELLLFPPWIEPISSTTIINFFLPYLLAGILAAITTFIMKKQKVDHELSLEFGNIIVVSVVAFLGLIIAQYVFEKHLIMMEIVPVMSSILLGYVGSIGYQYLTESKQKKVIKGIFSNYVNKEVVDKMLEDPDAVSLGGENVELTVMFSDVAGFTTISESMEPEALVDLLNEYLGAMTDNVLASGGTLDKYIGDAVMAFWGAPVAMEDHAIRACRSVLQQMALIDEYQPKWQAQNYPHIMARFGVNTGKMIVGNMGSASRFNYTVIGDAVNLGARLEPANKDYDTLAMISETTYEKAKEEFLCRQLDLMVVKGKTKPVKVYELMADLKNGQDHGKKQELVHVYNTGLNFYYQQRWDEAIAQFQKVMALQHDDGPSKLYIKRCQDYKLSPPEPGWTGVYIRKTK